MIDFRVRQAETREVRDGNNMVFQYRNNIIELDGRTTYGKWKTSGVAENYGDCFDEKPKTGFFKWLFN